MVRIPQLISKYRMKRYLSKIRAKKPSLLEYYAMYLTGKNLRELTEQDIKNAERELIPLILKHYLNPELTWDERVQFLLLDLWDFYLHFCKRKRYLNLTQEDTLKLATGEYSLEEMLNWCKSPVPKTKNAFRNLLGKTLPEHLIIAIAEGYLTRKDIIEAYRRRGRKLIPKVRTAVEKAFPVEKAKLRDSEKVLKKKRSNLDVFSAYLDVAGLNSPPYLERTWIEHEFRVKLARIWFTSRNREERLRRLEAMIPGLINKVGYTKLWDYVRTEIDEFILVDALSCEQITDYLERNKWRLGKELTRKFERALELLKKSYREKT